MLGFIPVIVNVIFLALMKGMSAVERILSPKDSLSICATTLVFTPCLLCLLVFVVTVLSISCWPVLTWFLLVEEPDHWVCHAFQIVPNAFPTCATNWSKLPSWFIIKSGSLFTSNHSSPDGSRTQTPAHENANTGLRFSTLVAYGCCTVTTSV